MKRNVSFLKSSNHLTLIPILFSWIKRMYLLMRHVVGEGRRSRFLNRLFRWRSSSTSRASSTSTASPSPQRQRDAVTSSVRRTSPVDLNLGDADTTAAPSQAAPVAVPDREELGALRHLAVELHTALRMSEEENLALKGSCYETYSIEFS